MSDAKKTAEPAAPKKHGTLAKTLAHYGIMLIAIMGFLCIGAILYTYLLHDHIGLEHHAPLQDARAGADWDIAHQLGVNLRQTGDEVAKKVKADSNQASSIIADVYAPAINANAAAEGMLKDPNQANCKGSQVMVPDKNYPDGGIKLEVTAACRSGFTAIVVTTDTPKFYKVTYESGDGDPLAALPTLIAGRGSIAQYDPTTRILKAEGDVFYRVEEKDAGKHRILTLAKIP